MLKIFYGGAAAGVASGTAEDAHDAGEPACWETWVPTLRTAWQRVNN